MSLPWLHNGTLNRVLKALFYCEEYPTLLAWAAELVSWRQQELLSFIQGFINYLVDCLGFWKAFTLQKRNPHSAIFTSVHNQCVMDSFIFLKRSWQHFINYNLSVNAYLFAAACSFTLKADRGVKMTIKQKLNNQSCFCRQVFQWNTQKSLKNTIFSLVWRIISLTVRHLARVMEVLSTYSRLNYFVFTLTMCL